MLPLIPMAPLLSMRSLADTAVSYLGLLAQGDPAPLLTSPSSEAALLAASGEGKASPSSSVPLPVPLPLPVPVPGAM